MSPAQVKIYDWWHDKKNWFTFEMRFWSSTTFQISKKGACPKNMGHWATLARDRDASRSSKATTYGKTEANIDVIWDAY